MLIVAALLAVLAFGLWRAQVRTAKSAVSYSKQAAALLADRAEYERALRSEMVHSLESQLSVFRTEFGQTARKQALEQAQLEFDQWKAKYTQVEREDAIKKSRAVNRGLVAEQLAPHMVGFQYNPKDCHFVGKPVDYIIFAGLDAGNLDKIVLLEVKTGESGLNARERQVRDAILAGRVSYEIFKLEDE